MNETEWQERLERLENSHRWRGRWLGLLTVVLALTAAPPFFSALRGFGGGPRVATTTNGRISIQAFWDRRGDRRLELGATPGGPAVHILGRDGVARLSAFATGEGDRDIPILLVVDPSSPQSMFQVDLLNGGRPELIMLPPTGKGRIDLSFLPDGDPFLRLMGKDGRVIFETPHPGTPAPRPAAEKPTAPPPDR